MQGRDTVYVTGTVELSRSPTPSYDVEDPIDYAGGAAVLAQAEPIDDDVEAPYRSPFE